MRKAVRYPYYAGSGLGELSWWDTYGPVLLQIIGSAATIGGSAWQQQITRNQISAQIQQATGASLPVGNQDSANKLALQLQASGMTAAEAQARANNIVLGTPLPSQYGSDTVKTEYPSWLLPAGIGLVLFVLLSRGKGGA